MNQPDRRKRRNRRSNVEDEARRWASRDRRGKVVGVMLNPSSCCVKEAIAELRPKYKSEVAAESCNIVRVRSDETTEAGVA